ncbi:molybdopterin-guanine dinucleotide biosynthesis protein B [Phocicoccus pinnipedialis]|uniref:Molybdopterin-guanine dinucleotide biosynthesis adapter protein n=1 Tax=Phocicoccus pinnipedialis TaxID=110845 RepID=A0A6V7R0K8_9BACL|nr:molybdopterin-guanine dinucleotide biosynthesis protein B [Jeotgalicoccus pinnipedialis]MBP1938744.1 molybdopterin-guanine dinucleotide biosynthesis protein B [Jeotgalicoccus pinnipedialis]CAD2070604.1 Molybdopterin-guanine dinucleotide biosynthesis adapter protein [Jeotgalicoccus pinnipedialis]
MKVLQIVGYKNTGKTTLMIEFLEVLKSRGKKVCAIKHHHIDFELHTTDSERFLEYADDVILNTPSVSYHSTRDVVTLAQQVEAAEKRDVDIVLIEGYKNESYEKVLLTTPLIETKTHRDDLEVVNCVKAFDLNTELDDAIDWFKEWSK